MNPPSNNSITANESSINKEMSLASRNDAKYIETNTQKYYNIVVDKRFESNNKVGGCC